MILDLTGTDRSSRSFSFEGKLDAFDTEFCGAEFSFGEVAVCGVASVDEKIVDVKATVTGEYAATCDRCARDVKKEYEAEFSQRFTLDADEENDDVVYSESEKIVLDEYLKAAVLSDLPMQILCREDCKGLCPTCGCDLNEGECGCEEEYTDPRFDILKNFKPE